MTRLDGTQTMAPFPGGNGMVVLDRIGGKPEIRTQKQHEDAISESARDARAKAAQQSVERQRLGRSWV